MIRGSARAGIELLGLIAGFAIWASAFAMLYGLHGLACSSGGTSTLQTTRAVLLGVLSFHVLLHIALIYWCLRRRRDVSRQPRLLIRRASLILSIGALCATLWTSAPIVFLRICDTNPI